MKAPNWMANRRQWKRKWTLCQLLFLALHMIASFLGYQAASRPAPLPLSIETVNITAEALVRQDDFSQNHINTWKRWDTDWYLKIAVYGYDPTDGTVVSLPRYPWPAASHP